MGLSQLEVARKLGLKSRGRLSEWESGRHSPGLDNLLRLSILYRTLIDQLYCELREKIRQEIECTNSEPEHTQRKK
jgi:transcriptional regulator with XRE-family HTH domain